MTDKAKSREIYISVDVEAAGPVPATFSMLSIGAVIVGDPKATFYVELKPVNNKSIAAAMKVVGRTLADFRTTGRDPKEAMTLFRDWILSVSKKRKPIFVGFNATFDWAFVNFYFQEYLDENPFGFGGVDIKSYYMGLTGSTWEDARSSRIAREFKSDSLKHTHNALDDALEQAEMLRRMMMRSTKG